jgi:hypothetical protein
VAGHRRDNAAIADLLEGLCLRHRLVQQYHHGNRAEVRLHSEVRLGEHGMHRNGANFTIAATDAEISGSFSGDQFIGQDLGATNFGGPGQ